MLLYLQGCWEAGTNPSAFREGRPCKANTEAIHLHIHTYGQSGVAS